MAQCLSLITSISWSSPFGILRRSLSRTTCPCLPRPLWRRGRSGSWLVYDAHELYPEQHHFKPEYVDALSRAEADLIGYADLVTTVNEFIAEEIGRSGIGSSSPQSS